MRCPDLVELISAYADGQTVPAQTEFVEAHLAGCRPCRVLLRRDREVALLLQHADGADEWQIPDLRLRVIHASGGRRRDGRPLRGGLAVGLIASLALAWALTGSTPPPYLAQVAQATATPAVGRSAIPEPITMHQSRTITMQALRQAGPTPAQQPRMRALYGRPRYPRPVEV
jgi:anti-sigma factor RsiW